MALRSKTQQKNCTTFKAFIEGETVKGYPKMSKGAGAKYLKTSKSQHKKYHCNLDDETRNV